MSKGKNLTKCKKECLEAMLNGKAFCENPQKVFTDFVNSLPDPSVIWQCSFIGSFILSGLADDQLQLRDCTCLHQDSDCPICLEPLASFPPKESDTNKGCMKESGLREDEAEPCNDEDDVNETVGKRLFKEPQGIFILTRGLSGEAKRQLLKGVNDLMAPLLVRDVPVNGRPLTSS